MYVRKLAGKLRLLDADIIHGETHSCDLPNVETDAWLKSLDSGVERHLSKTFTV